jgi:hypothetical protein
MGRVGLSTTQALAGAISEADQSRAASRCCADQDWDALLFVFETVGDAIVPDTEVALRRHSPLLRGVFFKHSGSQWRMPIPRLRAAPPGLGVCSSVLIDSTGRMSGDICGRGR